MIVDQPYGKSALRREGHVRDESSVFAPKANMTLLTEGAFLVTALYKHRPPDGGPRT